MSQEKKYEEIEVKLNVKDLTAISQQLDALGAVLKTPRTYERNIRYENTENNFTNRGIVLRLRQDNATRLTYKEPLDSESMLEGVHKRFEAEITVSDFDTTHLILIRLGFHRAMMYEKYRTTYRYHDAEIVLDEMPYGNFIEIEATSTDAIDAILAELSLDNSQRIPYSYAQLFEILKQHLNLNFDDLSFENFDGIPIPEHIFTMTK